MKGKRRAIDEILVLFDFQLARQTYYTRVYRRGEKQGTHFFSTFTHLTKYKGSVKEY